jgi:peptidoglycan/xylan/chitin deacetylase (PgdA/CDA1 family)
MLVPRRVAPLVAGIFPLLVPTLGGSEVSQASQLDDPPLAWLEGQPDVAASDAAAPRAPATLWSPGHGPHTRFKPASSRRELLLSFDDGPDLRGTPVILDELDRRGLKAIFFVTGWRMTGQRPEDQARRDLLRKIAAHGHLVANHTMTHHNLCEKPNETASEIDRNSELIQQATGVRPLLFRAPYGAFCKHLEVALAARELPDIGWNLDPQDWKHDSEAAVYAYLTDKLAHLEGRGILLLHDTHLASVRALPRVLDWLARENERAVQEGRAPVQIIDYAALVPHRPLAESGLERLVTALAEDVAGDLGTSLARIWP